MAVEDMTEEERREINEKLEMLQSVIRTFELKAKNAHDHSKYCIFIFFVYIFPHDAMLMRYKLSSCVCLSEVLSFTNMTKLRIIQTIETLPYDSPGTLVY